MESYEQELTVHLLEFLDVSTIDSLIKKQITKMIESQQSESLGLPLLTSLLNDIKMQRNSSDGTTHSHTPLNHQDYNPH